MVAGISHLYGYALEPSDTDLYQPTAAPADDAWGRTVNVPRYVEGRAPQAADEISLSEHRAALLGVEVGDPLVMDSYSPAQMARAQSGDESVFGNPEGPTIELRVVGIERTPQTLATDRDLATISTLSPAFTAAHGDDVGLLFELVAIDVVDRPGAAEELVTAVHAIPGLEELQFEATQAASPVSATLAFVARALLVLALVAGLAGLVTIALLLSPLSPPSMLATTRSWTALGLGRRARIRLWVLGVLPAVGIGTALAVVGAAAASIGFPFGLGGRAEPDPGMDVDGVVLLVGSIGLLLVVLAMSGLVAARSVTAPRPARTDAGSTRSRGCDSGDRVCPSPGPSGHGSCSTARAGGGSRPSGWPIAAVALGSIGLVAVLTFGASRAGLYAEPADWGKTWDVVLSRDDAASVAIPSEDVLSRARVRVETLEIGGRPLEVRGFDAITGPLALPVAAGRPPGAGEIALGAETMRSLSVGDR